MEEGIYKVKDHVYSEMLRLYGKVLTNLYIFEKLIHCKNLIEIEEAKKRIKATFKEEKEYNKRRYKK